MISPDRLLVVVDARSSHLVGWLPHLSDLAREVVIASTFEHEIIDQPANVSLVYLGGSWSRLERSRRGAPVANSASTAGGSLGGSLVRRLRRLDSLRQAALLTEVVDLVRPTLVHAMRTTYEGLIAHRSTPPTIPLVLSVWGNDFTLHAQASKDARETTRAVIRRCAGLHADCVRDVNLARDFGLSGVAPTLVAPTGGGVEAGKPIRGNDRIDYLREHLGVTFRDDPVIVNPRGLRSYVKTETFLRAVEIAARESNFTAIGIGLAGHGPSEQAAKSLAGRLVLTPVLPKAIAQGILACSDLSISPSVHDGTPNTLLESMATGCVPIFSPLASIAEWIDDGENGLLVQADDATGFARAIVSALGKPDWLRSAATKNTTLIYERSSPDAARSGMADLYTDVLERAGR